MDDILELVYNKFELDPEEWFIKPRKPANAGLKVKEVVPILLEFGSQKAIEEFNLSKSTFYRVIKSKFPNKDSKQAWKQYLLLKINYKHCSGCKDYLIIDQFSKDNSTADKLSNKCKNCERARGKISYLKFKDYNPAKRAKYRAAQIQAVPKWASLYDIDNFYINCPEGYHVDHIIPLQGNNVCGLHVINNLQYLLATENQSKSNKWDWYTQN